MLVWTQPDISTVITEDLAANFSGDRKHFASSTIHEANGQYKGKIEWEFLPDTERFGSVILVRIELPGTIVSDYILRDGEFKTLYEDTKNKIEYMSK